MTPSAMPKSSRGFSLLEVLVAFVILSLILGVSMRIFSGGLRNASSVAEYQQAMALAQSKLATIGIETPLRPSESFGEFGSGYRWQVRIRPYWEPQMQISGQTLQAGQAAPILPASLMLVEVQVQWGGIEKPRRAILTTLRLASGVAS